MSSSASLKSFALSNDELEDDISRIINSLLLNPGVSLGETALLHNILLSCFTGEMVED